MQYRMAEQVVLQYAFGRIFQHRICELGIIQKIDSENSHG